MCSYDEMFRNDGHPRPRMELVRNDFIIGESGYGKPILDRTLKFTEPIPFALKVGWLAFGLGSARQNVDFPRVPCRSADNLSASL